jgi:subtilisin family serine protease
VPDIVVSLPCQISVLLGRGDGIFNAPTTALLNSGAPVGAQFVSVADLNCDGLPDLVASGYQTPGFYVALGKGDGTFALADTVNLPANPSSNVVADFNGDGVPDIAVATAAGITLSTGNAGDPGHYTSAPLVIHEVTSLIVAADPDGTDCPDLVTATSIYLSNGDGTFSAGQPYTSTPSVSIQVLDLNGDGHPDIVAANPAGTVSVYLAEGEDCFLPVLVTVGELTNVAVGTGTFTPGENEIAVLSNDGFPVNFSFIEVLELGHQLDQAHGRAPGYDLAQRRLRMH